MLAEIFIEKERKAWLSGKKEGIEKGIETGIEKGERESKIKIAKKLVRSKININQIKEWTNLSEEEINNIITNMNK